MYVCMYIYRERERETNNSMTTVATQRPIGVRARSRAADLCFAELVSLVILTTYYYHYYHYHY